MPIKPENKKRYPRNWAEIRRQILQRAKNRCEFCGVPNRVYRNTVTGQWTEDEWQAETWACDGIKVSRIVLTIAHLDHVPENCDSSNLRALCQRCHLQYDIQHHQQTAYKTRRAGKAIGDLFNG